MPAFLTIDRVCSDGAAAAKRGIFEASGESEHRFDAAGEEDGAQRSG